MWSLVIKCCRTICVNEVREAVLTKAAAYGESLTTLEIGYIGDESQLVCYNNV
jgi:hypothetical protein